MSILNEIKQYLRKYILSIILALYGIFFIFAIFRAPTSANSEVKIGFYFLGFLYLISGLGISKKKLWSFFLAITIPIIMIFLGIFRIIELFIASKILDEGMLYLVLLPNLFILPLSFYVTSANGETKSKNKKFGFSFKTISILSFLITILIQSAIVFLFKDAFQIASLSFPLWAILFSFLKIFR
ncbi:hypothetical protein [[Eubacterium] cellulosolvens]